MQQAGVGKLLGDPILQHQDRRRILGHGHREVPRIGPVVPAQAHRRLIERKGPELADLNGGLEQRRVDRKIEERLEARKPRRIGLHLNGIAEAAGHHGGGLHAGGVRLQGVGNRGRGDPGSLQAGRIRGEVVFEARVRQGRVGIRDVRVFPEGLQDRRVALHQEIEVRRYDTELERGAAGPEAARRADQDLRRGLVMEAGKNAAAKPGNEAKHANPILDRLQLDDHVRGVRSREDPAHPIGAAANDGLNGDHLGLAAKVVLHPAHIIVGDLQGRAGRRPHADAHHTGVGVRNEVEGDMGSNEHDDGHQERRAPDQDPQAVPDHAREGPGVAVPHPFQPRFRPAVKNGGESLEERQNDPHPVVHEPQRHRDMPPSPGGRPGDGSARGSGSRPRSRRRRPAPSATIASPNGSRRARGSTREGSRPRSASWTPGCTPGGRSGRAPLPGERRPRRPRAPGRTAGGKRR